VKKIAIALVLGAMFSVGCGDKGADGAKSGAAASGSAKADSKGGGSSGSKVCDDYWTKLRACNEKALKDAPDAAKEQMKKGFDDAEKMSKDAWKDIKGDALDTACKAAMDALAANPNCPK
jgi:hypothetical protein